MPTNLKLQHLRMKWGLLGLRRTGVGFPFDHAGYAGTPLPKCRYQGGPKVFLINAL